MGMNRFIKILDSWEAVNKKDFHYAMVRLFFMLIGFGFLAGFFLAMIIFDTLMRL
jgi:hypothetical protein